MYPKGMDIHNVYTNHYNVSNTVVNFTTKKRPTSTLYFTAALLIVLVMLFLTNMSILPSIFTVFVVSSILLFVRRNEVIEESVLVIKDFGVQLRIKYASGLEEIKFLERAKIEGVIIHEFIKGSAVCFALAFMVYESTLLVVAFKNIYPGLDFIKRIYLKCIEYETVRR